MEKLKDKAKKHPHLACRVSIILIQKVLELDGTMRVRGDVVVLVRLHRWKRLGIV